MENRSLERQPEALSAAAVPPRSDIEVDPAQLVGDLRKLVEKTGSDLLRREWRRLWARANEPHFSVAVVGERSRGKSTLINRLLGEDLLPVGPLPTTPLLTRVLFAPEASLAGVHPDGRRELLENAPESWRTELEGTAEPRWAALQFGVPSEWLRESGLQLFDTPGAGDLSEAQIEAVIDTISICDATLVAINATMALSLTERAFLEQHVLARNVPRVLVVLTHIDEVRPADQSVVLRHLQERLARIHPGIALATAHSEPVLVSRVGVEIAGPTEIAAILTAWTADPDHRERVRQQILTNLSRFLSLLAAELEARLANAGLAAEERRRQTDASLRQLDHTRLDWEDLRLGMRARCDGALAWMREQLTEAARAIAERLTQELRRVPDPGLWWNQELPFRLRQELGAVARLMGDPLQRRLAVDAVWLRQEVQARFGRPVSMPTADPFRSLTELDSSRRAAQSQNLGSLRVLTRIGAGAATILGYLLFGPLGTAASVGAGLLGEYLLVRRAAEQKAELLQILPSIIDRTLERGHELARGHLLEAYGSLLTETIEEERVWYEVRRETLAGEPSTSGGPGRLQENLVELRRYQNLIDPKEV